MVKYIVGDAKDKRSPDWFQNNRLNNAFRALSSPKRRIIIAKLGRSEKNRPKSIAHLDLPFKMSLPALMKHMQILEEGRLVKRAKVGQRVYYRLNHQTFHTITKWFEPYDKIWQKKIANIAKIAGSYKK